MKIPPPLPLYGAAARFADGLLAWWLARAPEGEPREERNDAVQRWEDEGGNIR